MLLGNINAYYAVLYQRIGYRGCLFLFPLITTLTLFTLVQRLMPCLIYLPLANIQIQWLDNPKQRQN